MHRESIKLGIAFEEVAERFVYETYAAFCATNNIDMRSPAQTPI